MWEDRIPKGRDWALPLFVSVLAGLFLWFGLFHSLFAQILMVACATVFGLWACSNFWNHVAYIWSDIRNESRAMEFKLSENFKIEKIATMDETQIKALRAGHHTIDIIPGESGPIEKLYGEDVYLYTAWWILVNSTSRNVYPINQFSDGTYHFDLMGDHAVDDRSQAHGFHIWLVRYGYAYWGRGNSSASWSQSFGPDEVLKRLGMDRETYKSMK